jgi:hypothetical protein
MKLKLKEEPKEWRKQALLTALGLALISSLLRWRRILPPDRWLGVLAALGLIAVCAALWPRLFRGYYRFSMRLGFQLSQFMGRVLLTLVFFLLVTPLGWTLRLAGKDLLLLKRPRDAVSHWRQARECSPLDQLF